MNFVWTLALQCGLVPIVMGGKWISIMSDSNSYKKVNGFGVRVTGASHMLLEVKACKGAEIQLQQDDTGSGSWVYCKLGGDLNEWTAMAASELCDDAGCGWLGYDYQPVLDCDNFKPFWLAWDAAGTFSVGKGNVLGSDVLVTGTVTPFDVNFFMVSHNDADVVAEWRILVDEAPAFISPASTGTTVVDVSEDTPTGDIIYTVAGTDNEGDSLTFTLDTHADVFEFVGGGLRMQQPLDYETLNTYRLLISMSDGRNTEQAMMTVQVTDVVDETPVITLSGTLAIPEEMAVDSVVNLYTVDDPDEGDTLKYAISGSESTFFSVDPTSGVLKIAQRIDRDQVALASVSFDLTVTDSSGLGSTRTITATIVDINDNNPAFFATSYTVDVAENTPVDTVVLELVVNDADDGTNAASRIVLQDGTQDMFNVTGSQLKTVTSNLDYESLSVYEFIFTIVAVNEDNLRTGTTTVSVKVTPVNEFDPVFDTPTVDGTNQFPEASLSEDVPVNHEISFTASDADLGVDGDVTFSLVSVLDSNGGDSSDKFEIDSNTGILKTLRPLDIDTATGGVAYHDVTVRITDGASLPRSSEGTMRFTLIDVNDNIPKFDSTHYAVTVNEDIAVGDVVATVVATDDDGDQVTLTLEGGGSYFEITGSDVVLKYPLDYSPVHVLTLRADDGTFTTNAVMLVTVVDVVLTTLTIMVATDAAIPEDQNEGTVLKGVFVTHGNTGAVTYSLGGTNAGFLSVNPTGELSYGSQRIDRDGSSGITTLSDITLKAADSSGNEATADLTFIIIDINDNAPLATVLAPTAQVRENSQDNQLVTSLDFTDADEDSNSNVTLNLVSGDVHNVFKVVDYDLYVRGTGIDYEALTGDNSYNIALHAVDNPQTSTPLTSTVIVHVEILGENEFEPSWTSPTPGAGSTFPEVTIKESATLGQTVETFVATDNDGGDDGLITYSVIDIKNPSGISVTGKFEMTTDGRLVVASLLDYDNDTGGVDYYTVTVAASDSSSTNVKSTTGNVKVILEDVEVENVIVLPKLPVADTTTELWVMRALVAVLGIAAAVFACVMIRSIIETMSSSTPEVTKPPDKVWMERAVSVTPHMSLESVIIDDDDDTFTSALFRPNTTTTETTQPSLGAGQGNDQ
ncbi:cadherin-related tumor suppressor-like [Haliotis cracherodii]|uniref:cadherin-related tumor suppressor-like n=1 Tax=Haliotis cracherodii TaxID=6455 RepID=UPI0039ECB63C